MSEDQDNPYAAPQIPAEAAPTVRDELFATQGCWRDGALIVTTLQGHIPPRCVKFGDAACQQELIRLTWYPPWAIAFLFLGPLFVIPFYFVGRRIDVAIATGQAWRQRKTRIRQICGIVIIGAAAVGLPALLMTARPGWPTALSGGLVIAAGIAFVGALLVGVDTASPPLQVWYADHRFVWLKGAGEPFLATLPPWPGAR